MNQMFRIQLSHRIKPLRANIAYIASQSKQVISATSRSMRGLMFVIVRNYVKLNDVKKGHVLILEMLWFS